MNPERNGPLQFAFAALGLQDVSWSGSNRPLHGGDTILAGAEPRPCDRYALRRRTGSRQDRRDRVPRRFRSGSPGTRFRGRAQLYRARVSTLLGLQSVCDEGTAEHRRQSGFPATFFDQAVAQRARLLVRGVAQTF